jgi:hypothetical protein
MRHGPSSPVRHAALAVLAGALLPSCATSRYTQSAVVAVPPDVKGRPGAAASLEVEGLRLSLECLDRAPQAEKIPSLALRIVFHPRELGYSFDPGQVTLRGADGIEWRPPGGRYYSVFPKAAFDLAFDTAVPADTSFDLVVGGLARGQKRLEPVTVRLARRSGRSIDRAYWLEFLGTLLEAYAGG